MLCILELDKAELELVMELLERERGELPPEIRHTDSQQFRNKLRGRVEVVDGLLQRMEGPFLPAC